MLKNSPRQPNREGDLSFMMCINIEKKRYQKAYDVFMVAQKQIIKTSFLVAKKLYNTKVRTRILDFSFLVLGILFINMKKAIGDF